MNKCRFAGLVIAGLAFVSTQPALAVTQTAFWVSSYWSSSLGERLAYVEIPSPSCSGLAFTGYRGLTLSGIRVYDISISSHAFNGTTVVADVQLWRYNGGWVKYGPPQRVQSAIPNNGVYNFVVLPDVRMSPQSAGYYTVTATISWWIPFYTNGVQAYKTFSFNSASDYIGAGNAVPGPGWIYLY